MRWRVFSSKLEFLLQIPETDKKQFFHNFKFHLLQTSGWWMRIYTYKHLFKPGKVIPSLCKKEERNINFMTIISPNTFQIK